MLTTEVNWYPLRGVKILIMVKEKSAAQISDIQIQRNPVPFNVVSVEWITEKGKMIETAKTTWVYIRFQLWNSNNFFLKTSTKNSIEIIILCILMGLKYINIYIWLGRLGRSW